MGLAVIAYVSVERPIHRLSISSSSYYWAASFSATLIAYLCIGLWSGLDNELVKTRQQLSLVKARYNLPVLYSHRCDPRFDSDTLVVCKFGSNTSKKTAVVFGDSIMAQWFPALEKIYVKQRGWQLIVLTKSACSIQNIPYYYPRIKRIYSECTSWREKAIHYIENLHPDVVIAGSTVYNYTSKQWIDGTEETVGRLSGASQQVIIFSPAPSLSFDGLDCLSQSALWPDWLTNRKLCESHENEALYERINGYLSTSTHKYDNVSLVVINKLVCPDGVCAAKKDGRVVFRDNQHMTADYVNFLSPKLEQMLSAKGFLTIMQQLARRNNL